MVKYREKLLNVKLLIILHNIWWFYPARIFNLCQCLKFFSCSHLLLFSSNQQRRPLHIQFSLAQLFCSKKMIQILLIMFTQRMPRLAYLVQLRSKGGPYACARQLLKGWFMVTELKSIDLHLVLQLALQVSHAPWSKTLFISISCHPLPYPYPYSGFKVQNNFRTLTRGWVEWVFFTIFYSYGAHPMWVFDWGLWTLQ